MNERMGLLIDWVSVAISTIERCAPIVLRCAVQGTRKCVVATNIAETSLTLDGIMCERTKINNRSVPTYSPLAVRLNKHWPTPGGSPHAWMGYGGSPHASMGYGGIPHASMGYGGSPHASMGYGGSPHAWMGCLPADRCARTHCGNTVSYVLPVRYVVDAGFCKLKCYNPKIGMDSLLVTPISQVYSAGRSVPLRTPLWLPKTTSSDRSALHCCGQPGWSTLGCA
jgi:hypothetical protein